MLRGRKSSKKKKLSIKREDGFTLIELIVAAALSLIVMTGIYSVYRSQSKSYIVREQITVMQQNLRAGMVVMTSDIRMAGYVHPFITLDPGDVAGISSDSTSTYLKFTLLADKSDDPNLADPASNDLETIEYQIKTNNLVRNVDGGIDQVIAENVDWLDFEYLDGSGVIVDPSTNPTDVRSIQITMVTRAGRGDADYSDTNVYENQRQTRSRGPYADNFRRRILTREINCRNL